MPNALQPIFAALSTDHTVAAWDIDAPDDPTLSVFEVSHEPKQVAYIAVATSDRKAHREALAEAGFPSGAYAPGTSIVWRQTDAAFEVWGPDSTGLSIDATQARLADGTVIARDQITALVPALEAEGASRRLHIRADGVDHLFAEQYDAAAAMGLSATPLSEWDDVLWMASLGYRLARWLGVPVEA